jgi:sec-independent protein translocase protein TatA
MMGLGFPELMIILVIIMIIFGAGKLPEIGSAFGRSIKNFKTSMKDAEQEEIAAEDQAEGSIEGAEAEDPKAVPESTGETAEVSESPESSEK